jgi:hypothetical protein
MKLPSNLHFLILFAFILFEGVSFADLNSASPLLRGRGTSPTIETLDSGRFTVKPTGRSPRSQSSAPESIAKPEPDEEPQVVQKTPPVVSAPAAPTVVESNPPPEQVSEPIEKPQPVVTRRSRPANTVELRLAPTHFYLNSSSAYSVRRYSSSSPGYTVGLSLWLSPYFGIEGEMQSSLGASLSSLTDQSISPLTIATNRVGLSFRRVDLSNALSAQTLWRVSYLDVSAKTSSSNLGRVSSYSSGVQVAFEAKLPSSLSYSHLVGVSIEPHLSHRERSGSQGVRSGKSSSSSAISATIGGEIIFNRKSQIFWSAQHRYEKNLFKGESTYPDPQSGFTPDGLNVDQGLTLFSIGYRWGH